MSGNDPDEAKQYEAVQNPAAAKGVRYLPLDQVVKPPIDSLLKRIEVIANRNQTPDPVEANWTLARDQTFGKSEDQKRRWENRPIPVFKRQQRCCAREGGKSCTMEPTGCAFA